MLVALGDVMGHGVAAALVMAGARAVLRDRAGAAGSLAELMGRLNRMLAADHGGSRFMTMHLSVIDAARPGRYRWVSAGHDPAIIYDPATGTVRRSGDGDMPLGVMDDTRVRGAHLRPAAARPGDRASAPTACGRCRTRRASSSARTACARSSAGRPRDRPQEIVQAILDA